MVAPAGALWGNRDFLLLWSGHRLSVFGSQASVPVLSTAGAEADAFPHSGVGVRGFVAELPAVLCQLPWNTRVGFWTIQE